MSNFTNNKALQEEILYTIGESLDKKETSLTEDQVKTSIHAIGVKAYLSAVEAFQTKYGVRIFPAYKYELIKEEEYK